MPIIQILIFAEKLFKFDKNFKSLKYNHLKRKR